MFFEQISLFNFSFCTEDPIYSKLSSLEEKEEINLHGLKIKRTEKFYEVEKCDEFHEGFRTMMDCYRFINSKI